MTPAALAFRPLYEDVVTFLYYHQNTFRAMDGACTLGERLGVIGRCNPGMLEACARGDEAACRALSTLFNLSPVISVPDGRPDWLDSDEVRHIVSAVAEVVHATPVSNETMQNARRKVALIRQAVYLFLLSRRTAPPAAPVCTPRPSRPLRAERTAHRRAFQPFTRRAVRPSPEAANHPGDGETDDTGTICSVDLGSETPQPAPPR